MASPKIVTFFLYDEAAGTALTGATPTFDAYKDDTGANLAQPAISEIGGGAYKFTPVFTTDKCIVAVINGGAGSAPRRQGLFLRPEDYYIDDILDLTDATFGKWVYDSGTYVMTLYRADGVTVLAEFDMQDDAGAPTATNPYRRVPV